VLSRVDSGAEIGQDLSTFNKQLKVIVILSGTKWERRTLRFFGQTQNLSPEFTLREAEGSQDDKLCSAQDDNRARSLLCIAAIDQWL
jgi:hypothetical protein